MLLGRNGQMLQLYPDHDSILRVRACSVSSSRHLTMGVSSFTPPNSAHRYPLPAHNQDPLK